MASFQRQIDGWLMKLGARLRRFDGWLTRLLSHTNANRSHLLQAVFQRVKGSLLAQHQALS
jgi:hypothetical protein